MGDFDYLDIRLENNIVLNKLSVWFLECTEDYFLPVMLDMTRNSTPLYLPLTNQDDLLFKVIQEQCPGGRRTIHP